MVPSSRYPRLIFVLAAAMSLMVACASTTVDPNASTASPGLVHPTGATDVILRLDETGGATSPTFLAIQPPAFTLYGDGTVLFRDLSSGGPPVWPGPSVAFPSFKITRLTEAQIQAVIADAIGDGALGSARVEYTDPLIAPIPSAIFTIDAGGVKKTVSVSGLDIDVSDGTDVLARAAFKRLAGRLRAFDLAGVPPSEAWAPTRYRGLLFEDPSGGMVGAKAWPWADLRPTDFIDNGRLEGAAVVSDTQARLLGGDGYQGGLMGFALAGPGDGRRYALQLRPLLPDETE